ncbi:MAG: hypothetical protein ACK5JN_24060 [Kluyvera sp.]
MMDRDDGWDVMVMVTVRLKDYRKCYAVMVRIVVMVVTGKASWL